MHIVICGAGQIGTAFKKLFSKVAPLHGCFDVHLWDAVEKEGVTKVVDFSATSAAEICDYLYEIDAAIVVNALPFNLNEKIALGARSANCHYIDFTEDDVQADAVQAIYRDSGLTCAVKCGLAPGFINYIGHSLVRKIEQPEKLMISVGALPRAINFSSPLHNYNLSWSIDGLVNEYIRPCRVRMLGKSLNVQPLTQIETVLLDGVQYEAALTSGGIGSLVDELKHVPNVYYKTLRYPGHYAVVKQVIDNCNGNFDAIKARFEKTFPFNKDDVIVVYAEATGTHEGRLVRHTFAEKFYGVDRLSAIQTTTAGAGVAVLELILLDKLKGIVTHSDVSLEDFRSTATYDLTYRRM